MNNHLALIKTKVFNLCEWTITDVISETESKEYAACQFKLNDWNIVSREAKVTPKKAGQFVNCWKRNSAGSIEPFKENDPVDFYTVVVSEKDNIGQFVFPSTILIEKGILSTEKKDGKRAFRVYPSWDVGLNKQSQKTQNWQLNYFYLINDSIDFKRVKKLYNRN